MGGPIGPPAAGLRRPPSLTDPDEMARLAVRRGCMRTEHRRGVFLLGMTVALSGCLKSVEYVRPEVQLKEGWTQPVAVREYEAAWWRLFDDATLDQLIEVAQRQNLPLHTAGLRISEARAQLARGRRAAVAAGPGGLRQRHRRRPQRARRQQRDRRPPVRGLPGSGSTPSGSWTSGAGTGASVRAETAQLPGHRRRLRRRPGVADRGGRAHVRRDPHLRDAHRAGPRECRAAGGGPADRRVALPQRRHLGARRAQATTLLESTRATIPQLEISLQQAQNALSTLLGQPTGHGARRCWRPPRGSRPRPRRSRSACRPSCCAGVPTSAAPSSRASRSATASASPRPTSIRASRSSGRSGPRPAAAAARVQRVVLGPVQRRQLFYSLGPRAGLADLQLRPRSRTTSASRTRASSSCSSTTRTPCSRPRRKWRTAWPASCESQEAAVFAQNAAAAAQRSVDLALVQYREGAVDYQRVLDAQRALLQEQNTLARTRSSVATN